MNKFLMLFIMLMIKNVYAEEYIVQNNQIKTDIAYQKINRISVKDDRISEVIGNENEYLIDSDNNLGQVFITPKIKGSFHLNIITELGRVIDADFYVKEIASKQVTLSFANMGEASIKYGFVADQASEIVELMRRITSNALSFTKSKDHVACSHLKNIFEHKDTHYRLIRAQIKDHNTLKESSFAKCIKNPLAIAIDYPNIYMIGGIND